MKILHSLKSNTLRCLLFVALCFGLTSAVYLSWLDRLVSITGAQTADWGSMVAGYLMQAAGMGVTILLLQKNGEPQRNFLIVLALFMAFTVPSLVTNSAIGIVAFGGLMNSLCGAIAGFYLFAIAQNQKDKSLIFGLGYAIAVVGVGLLYLPGNGFLLRGTGSLTVYVLLTAVLAWMTITIKPFQTVSGEIQTGQEDEKNAGAAVQADYNPVVSRRQIALACGTVTLISLVKNLGFGFPSADIEAGLIPELSRIPYAVGLIAAGFLNDKSRRSGMMCTVSALIIPFVMLGLVDEPISSTVFWGLDYLFFGFFSVYRIVVFLDIAEKTHHWELAPLGLLLGRLGDAAGTAVYLPLSGQKILLISIAAVLFIPAVFMLHRVHTNLYEPEFEKQRNEHEVFESFCLFHDLSAREKEIFRMMLDDRTNGEIAAALFITENTVKYHVRNVLQKTGSGNRSDLKKKYKMALYPEMKMDEPEGGKIISMM